MQFTASVIKVHGRDRFVVVAALNEFQVSRVSDLQPHQVDAFIRCLGEKANVPLPRHFVQTIQPNAPFAFPPPHPEYQYLGLLRELLDCGIYREGRNGGTYSLFGRQMRFDLQQGFPLLTTKKVHFKSIVAELLWMLRGDTNNQALTDQGVTIWDEWADADGELGRIYGAQWRDWRGTNAEGFLCSVDQITALIEGLKADPHSRRHVVSAWQPAELDQMALPPCHYAFQAYVAEGRFSLAVVMRSNDFFLGAPFNIAQYALLTHLLAREVDLEVGELVYTMHDVHLYANHVEQAREQLAREPRPLPKFAWMGGKVGGTIFDTTPDDFALIGYTPHPAIKADVSA